jgi:hypothetical protein
LEKYPSVGLNKPVYRCGSLGKYEIDLKQDKVEQDGLIFYDINGFENFPKALLTVF